MNYFAKSNSLFSALKKSLTETKSDQGFSSEFQPIGVLGTCSLCIIILITSFLLRKMVFDSSVGLLFGIGVEEAFRYLEVIKKHDGPMTGIMPPLPTLMGYLFHQIFPSVPYITRFISLAFGIITPCVLFLALRRYGPYISVGAAFSLVFSPPHILFSTIGTAESISIFFLFSSVGALNQSIAEMSDGDRTRAYFWSVTCTLFVMSTMASRYENWVIAPVVFLFFFVHLRKHLLWGYLVFIGPMVWLVYLFITQGAFLPTLQTVPTVSLAESSVNAAVIFKNLLAQLDVPILLFSLVAIAGIRGAKRDEPIIFYSLGIFLIIIFASIAGKIHSDLKYSYNLAVWMHVLAGFGMGVFFQSGIRFVKYLFTRIKFFGARFHRVGLIILFSLLIFVYWSPHIERFFDYVFSDQPGNQFSRAHAFVIELNNVIDRKGLADGPIYAWTSQEVADYLILYADHSIVERVYQGAYFNDCSTTEILKRTLIRDGSIQKGALIITEPYSGPHSYLIPNDDLGINDSALPCQLKLLILKFGFAVYLVEDCRHF